jgi:hypothetical protein
MALVHRIRRYLGAGVRTYTLGLASAPPSLVYLAIVILHAAFSVSFALFIFSPHLHALEPKLKLIHGEAGALS